MEKITKDCVNVESHYQQTLQENKNLKNKIKDSKTRYNDISAQQHKSQEENTKLRNELESLKTESTKVQGKTKDTLDRLRGSLKRVDTLVKARAKHTRKYLNVAQRALDDIKKTHKDKDTKKTLNDLNSALDSVKFIADATPEEQDPKDAHFDDVENRLGSNLTKWVNDKKQTVEKLKS